MPLLNPDTFTSQLFWLAIFFIGQYILMTKFIVPVFRNTFAQRKDHIKNEIETAEKYTNIAEQLKSDYEEKLEHAKQENIRQMHELLDKIKRDSDLQMERLENELAADVIKHEKRIQNFVEQVSGELEELALETAADVIHKISSKKPSKQQLTKYMN